MAEGQHLGLNLPSAQGQTQETPALSSTAPTGRDGEPAAPGGSTAQVPATEAPGASTDILNQLLTRISELEHQLEQVNRASNPNPLVADDETVDRLRQQALLIGTITKGAAKLEPVVPGFKSDPHTLPVPKKVAKAILQFDYIPYTSLTREAFMKASRTSGESNFKVDDRGLFTEVGLSRKNELDMNLSDWIQAAETYEREIRKAFGDERADRLASHNKEVMKLVGLGHAWPLVLQYDIRQREISANDHRHDISGFDKLAFDGLAHRYNQNAIAAVAAIPPPTYQPFRPLKRAFAEDHAITRPKHARTTSSSHCFRCGREGHYPSKCSATTTITGRAPAPVAPPTPGVRSANALIGPKNANFCFRFATSSTCAQSNCSFYHGCSICGATTHGAGSCTNIA